MMRHFKIVYKNNIIIKMNWNGTEGIDSCFYTFNVNPEYNKICSFDYDDTLAHRASADAIHNVIDKLKDLYNTHHNIVVFSNQNGIDAKKTNHNDVRQIFQNFQSQVDIPISFFYSTSKNNFRKPHIGMYKLFQSLISTNSIQTQNFLYYCGDAAGRPTDFNISDLYFANNIRIPFKLPEEIFDNNTTQNSDIATSTNKKFTNIIYADDNWQDGIITNKRTIVPIALLEEDLIGSSDDDADTLPPPVDDDDEIKEADKESHVPPTPPKENAFNIPSLSILLKYPFNKDEKYLVIMVGPQGSGKSTLSKYFEQLLDYNIINNDIIRSKPKAKSYFDKYYSTPSTKGIVIDNTNPTKSDRDYWINKNVSQWNVVIIYINIEKPVCIHSTHYRAFHNNIVIPTVAIHTWYKRFQEPTTDEGHVITLNGIIHDGKHYNHNLRFS
tara:strand:- start:1608 stop:2927 length:1320 start_codon:yes stop_codon:yes gene_type:complete